MADENTGALGSAADAAPHERPGGIGALSTLAYGMGGQSPLAMAPDLLEKVLPHSRTNANEDMAFWGGLTDPEGNKGQDIGLGLGNAVRSQVKQRTEQDKLRAAYMPLIMQSIIGSQQMTLSAANATRDYLKDINPKYQSWMSGLRTNGNVPTKEQALTHLAKFAGMYQLPPGLFSQMAMSLPDDPKEMETYLDGMILSQKPEAALPASGQNAAGQGVAVNPVMGTQRRLTAPGAPAAAADPSGLNDNPSKVAVTAGEEGIKGFTKEGEEHATMAQSLHDMVARMTEVRDLQGQVQAGRYAKGFSTVGAMVKDLTTRLGMPEDKANELANKIAGATPGSPNAVAAAQSIGAIGLMESMAQLRSSVGQGNRINMPEFKAFQDKIQALSQDPEAFAKIYDFSRQQYGNHVNKYAALSQAMKDAGYTHSPYHGDSKYHVSEASRLLADAPKNSVGTGPVQEPTPSSALGAAGVPRKDPAQATGQPGGSGAQTAAGNGPATKAPPPLKDERELTLYEKGSILSPRGVPIVKGPNGWRYAKKVQ